MDAYLENLCGKMIDARKRDILKNEQLGMDLTQVEGSGPGGRITLKDVMNAAKQG